MEQSHFFNQFQIDEKTFQLADISWESLLEIKKDFEERLPEFNEFADFMARRLRRAPSAHSVRVRVKDPDHLIAKIIRKRAKAQSNGEDRDIRLENYREEITDLVGLRILHLFKNQWLQIHNYIINAWETHEDPCANVRQGDPQEWIEQYKKQGCEIRVHPAGYRSVHYIINSDPGKQERYNIEIQVRTIFEEGWSEIDHEIRYPYRTDNAIINHFLQIFNRLSGNADEMGGFVKRLDDNLETLRKEQELQRQKYIGDVEKLVTQVEANETEKKELMAKIAALGSPSLLDQFLKGLGFFAGGVASAMSDYQKLQRKLQEQSPKENMPLLLETLSATEEPKKKASTNTTQKKKPAIKKKAAKKISN